MPVFELICLANSRKLGQRCVAGLTADTAEWIRPVSQAPHGELTYHHRNLGPAGDPQNFDIIRIGLAKHSPTSSQPENWLIDGSGWQLVSRPAASSLHALLNSAVHTEGKLFGTISDHVPVATFSSIPASKSLALVKPESSRWFTNRYGKARVLLPLRVILTTSQLRIPRLKLRLEPLKAATTNQPPLALRTRTGFCSP